MKIRNLLQGLAGELTIEDESCLQIMTEFQDTRAAVSIIVRELKLNQIAENILFESCFEDGATEV